jgi:antitoxin YefM
MRTISYTQARASLKTVLDNVAEDSDCTVITRRDSDDAVVMSLDQYNGIMETLHLFSSPANAAHLQWSLDQYRKGDLVVKPLADD